MSAFKYKPTTKCLQISSCPPKIIRGSYANILDSVEEIPSPLIADKVYFVKDGDSFNLYYVDSTGLELRKFAIATQNIEVSGLIDGDTVSHLLSTQKIKVSFFNTSNREVREMDYEPLTDSTFKLYLPTGDGIVNTFSGDIFVEKRD